MITKRDRDIIYKICSMPRKRDGNIVITITPDGDTRAIATTDTTTISGKLSKNAIATTEKKFECLGITGEQLKSLMTFMPDGDIQAKLVNKNIVFTSGRTKRELATCDSPESVAEITLDEDSVDQVPINNMEEFEAGLKFAAAFKHKDPARGIGYLNLVTGFNVANFIATDSTILAYFIYKQNSNFPPLNLLIGDSQLAAIYSVLKESKSCVLSYDDTGKYGFSGSYLTMVALQPALKPAPADSMIKRSSPIDLNGRKTENSASCIVDSANLKNSIAHCQSIFSKEDNPLVTIKVDEESLEITATSAAKGYDKVSDEMRCVTTGKVQLELSTNNVQKAISLYEGAVCLSWRKDLLDRTPIAISSPTDDQASSFILVASTVKAEN